MPCKDTDFHLLKDFPDPVFVMAKDGSVLAFNHAFSSRFNHFHTSILGRDAFELLAETGASPEIVASRKHQTEKVLRSGKHVAFDDRIDGDFWRIFLYPVFDSDGEISKLLVIVQDVTDQRRAEIENEDFRAKMDYALESSHVSIWSLDLEKNQVIRTQEHDRIFGYDSLLPHWSVETFFEHLYPEDIPMVTKHYEIAMATRSDFNLECRIRRADGEIRWINLVGTYRFAKPESSRYVVGIVADITEKKAAALELEQLQAQLQQSQKMELIGQLAGGIAHDFNNSLTAIIGNIELALSKIDSSLPAATNLRNARQSALRSADLTRQLLGFARKQLTQPKPLSLNREIENLIQVLKPLFRDQIRCEWQPGQDEPAIFFDPAQLDQVMSNLCINARDAIDQHGTITISTGTVCITKSDCAKGHPCQTPGEYAVLSVSDTGSGIDSLSLPHIFEPFFTTKPQGKGTGLGLSTVYGIVKQNGGCIDCQTEPCNGTSFRVYFPLHRTETATRGHETPEQIFDDATTGTVLLVEDEPHILNILEQSLEEKGFKVFSALDAESALVIVQKQNEKIDLLVTDIVLPGMNGLELGEQLQALNPNLQALFMSAFSLKEPARRGVSSKPVHFIRKPFTISDFMRMVYQVMRQK